MKQKISKESKLESGYKWGFETDIKSEKIPKGLNEKTIRLISKLKEEPKWMLDYRLKAYRSWVRKKHSTWAKLKLPKIDLPFHNISPGHPGLFVCGRMGRFEYAIKSN